MLYFYKQNYYECNIGKDANPRRNTPYVLWLTESKSSFKSPVLLLRWHHYGTEWMRQWSTKDYITLESSIFTLHCTACVSTCSADRVHTSPSLNRSISFTHFFHENKLQQELSGSKCLLSLFFFLFYLQGVCWLFRILVATFTELLGLAGRQLLAVSPWFEQHLEHWACYPNVRI